MPYLRVLWGIRSRGVFDVFRRSKLAAIGLLSLAPVWRLLVPIYAFGYATMGGRGIEPLTSAMSTLRSSRLS